MQVHSKVIRYPIGGAVLMLAVAGLFAMNAIFAEAEVNPTITSGIQNNANATTTSASIGAVVYDKVIVATSTGIVNGTVDFNLYPNTSCSGTAVTQSGVALVNGMATSSTTSVPATGLSFKVHYNGQTDVYPPLDGDCEPLRALGTNATISTNLSTTTAIVGNFAHDSATLAGVTTNASGTVAYSIYSNNGCSLNKQNAGTRAVISGVVPDSDAIQFNTPGSFFWQAVYSGDAQNSAATSSCGSEILAILATSTQKGHIVIGKVTVPSGDATSFHFNTGGRGYASFDLTGSSTPNDQLLFAGTYSITESFRSGWTLTSSRCSVNGGASSAYTPGSNLTLGAGDTINCTFTNTKATSTPPTKPPKDCDRDDNNNGDDNDDDSATSTDNGHHGFPFNILPDGFPFTHKGFKDFFSKLPTAKVHKDSTAVNGNNESDKGKNGREVEIRMKARGGNRDTGR